MVTCDKPTELWVFVGFLAATASRALMLLQLFPKGNTVKMFGGPNPNVTTHESNSARSPQPANLHPVRTKRL